MTSELTRLIADIKDLSCVGRRVLIGLAGPPGVGKSTYAEVLRAQLSEHCALTAVVPMDGFHFDNAVLTARGSLPSKGRPDTFDTAGFAVMLNRLRDEADVAVPLFDRKLDMARASAFVVTAAHRIVIVEGAYLLLQSEPWAAMQRAYDRTILLSASRSILEDRLIQRWIDHGMTLDAARARARDNDMANVDLVLRDSDHGAFSFSTS